MDAAMGGLLALGVLVFSVGMFSAQNASRHRRAFHRTQADDDRQKSPKENPIESAAVGPGQGKDQSVSGGSGMLSGVGR
jgi:hypothetical protein